MTKDPALLGHMFDVEIMATGKHFLRGRVLEESLVSVPLLTTPLAPGQVSGTTSKAAASQSSSSSLSSSVSPSAGRTQRSLDVWLIVTLCVAVLAVILRFFLSPLS